MKRLFFAFLTLTLISCDGGQTPKQYAAPNPPQEKVQDDFEVFEPVADVLFVIDDSGSMYSHQKNLAANIDLFTDEFTKNARLDYQIGVITTDTSNSNRNGKLNGYPRFVTPQTPNGAIVLRNNLLVGTSGSAYERHFDAVFAAIGQQNAIHNADFFRPRAALAVIFLTDTEDQSTVSSTALYSALLSFKGNDPNKVLGYGALIDPTAGYCAYDDGPSRRVISFLNLVINQPGNYLSICDPNFGTSLAGLAKNIVTNAGRTIYLKRIPDPKTLRVSYGAINLPLDPNTGWSFDADRNAVILGDQIDWNSQPLGSQVKVHYDAISMD